jgi:hypothetical protein
MDIDPITTAIVVALTAGTASGLTEASKAAITDGYQALKGLLVKRFGGRSQVVQAVEYLESKPESLARQEGLAEEIRAVLGEQDDEVLAAAKQLLTLAPAQQAGFGKFTIQNNAPVHGQQNIGDHNTNTNTQTFGVPPEA